MAFLHPEQARIVRRTFNGPGRASAARPGTGKTVVALHRAAHIARTTGGRVLVTTYVRTLPQRDGALYGAARARRRRPHRLPQRARLRLRRARAAAAGPIAIDADGRRPGLQRPLGARRQGRRHSARSTRPPATGRTRSRYVLKGRGLTDFDDYARAAAHGALPPAQPRTARRWSGACTANTRWPSQKRGIFDWEDVDARGRGVAGRDPAARLLRRHRRRGARPVVRHDPDAARARRRRPDGFNLVSDGQQTIYPGGYTLAEAGVAISGRGVVLNRNYRNTAEIVEFARSLVAGDQAPDIEGGPARARPAEVLRHGARPVYTVFSSRSVHDKSLVERMRRRRRRERGTTSFGDIGVLALYYWHAREAAEALDGGRHPDRRAGEVRRQTRSTPSRSAPSSAPRASSSKRCWSCALPRTWCRPTSRPG